MAVRLLFRGMLGLQRQVLLSSINIAIATLRGLGVILILWKFSPTLQAFFFWQVAIGLLQTCLAGWFLRYSLPRANSRPAFKAQLLRGRWRFAAGIGGITMMAVILLQMDKFILSRLSTLEMFGYYVLASTVATGLYLLVVPMFFALYPRFTQLVSLGDQDALKHLYHEILSLLVIGTALNGLMHLPYALEFAYGRTKLAFSINSVAVLVLAPSIVLMASFYG